MIDDIINNIFKPKLNNYCGKIVSNRSILLYRGNIGTVTDFIIKKIIFCLNGNSHTEIKLYIDPTLTIGDEFVYEKRHNLILKVPGSRILELLNEDIIKSTKKKRIELPIRLLQEIYAKLNNYTEGTSDLTFYESAAFETNDILRNIDYNFFVAKDFLSMEPMFGIKRLRYDSFNSKVYNHGNNTVYEKNELAICDLLINHTLIDIKSNIRRQFLIRDFFQLLRYYAWISYANERIEHFDNKISRIGIFYSRYNDLWTFDLNDVFKSDSLEKFLSLSSQMIKKTGNCDLSELMFLFKNKTQI